VSSSVFLTKRERVRLERGRDVLAKAVAEGRLQERVAKRAPIEEKTELERLRKRVAELEGEPDPDKAPFRGTSTASNRTPDAERPSALKVAQKRAEEEQLAYLERIVSRHPDPEMRQRAAETLARRGAA
jgi:hypothetical protein